MTDSLAMVYLKAGQVFDAFFTPLINLFGGYVYAYMLGVLWLGLYIRTKDVGVPTLWLMWIVYLYGTFMPGTVSSGIMTLCLVGGVAGIIIKAYVSVK